MKSRTIWAAVPNTFNSGPVKVGTLGILQIIEPQEGRRVKVWTQGVDMATQSTADRDTLSPSSPASPGRHRLCWPSQVPRDFCLEVVKEMTLVYRLAFHQKVEIPGTVRYEELGNQLLHYR